MICSKTKVKMHCLKCKLFPNLIMPKSVLRDTQSKWNVHKKFLRYSERHKKVICTCDLGRATTW